MDWLCLGSDWDIWPLNYWLIPGGFHFFTLDLLTIVFFTVLLHGDLHLPLGSFAVRFTIWGQEVKQEERVRVSSCDKKSPPEKIVFQLHQASWKSFKCAPLCHTICAPRVFMMFSKCHCEPDYSLHRSSCVCPHAPSIFLPTFPDWPAPSSVSWHALCALRATEFTPAQKKVAGWGN